MVQPTNRVTPLGPKEWPRGFAAALESALRPDDARHPVPPRDPSSPKGLNAVGLLAHHPELSTAFNHLIRHALYFSTLTPRQRELVVLRVAHLRRSPYEWAQHVYQAGVAGISRDEIEGVRSDLEAHGWSPLERALLAATDDLVAEARISDDVYSALSVELGTEQMMDLVFTVGAYELFAMAMRTFDVQIDEDLRPYL